MPFEFSRSRAPRTTQLYESVYGDWERYCSLKGYSALPARPDEILEFLHERKRDHSTSALSARKSAIVAAHRDARAALEEENRGPYKIDSDDKLKLGWKEILREKGNRHTPRAPLCSPELGRVLDQLPTTLEGTMNRAILLVGFACALRRSEIAALNRDDIEFTDTAMFVHIRRSKTDQSGQGVTLKAKRSGKGTCPVAAMEKWIADGKVAQALPDDDGKVPLFAHPRFKTRNRIDPTLVYLVVKEYGRRAGLDPKRLGAHSLRRGFGTEVLRAKVPLPDSMEAMRHKTVGVHVGYGEPLQNNSALDVLGI